MTIKKQIITLLVIFVPGMYFGFVGKPTEMGLAIVLGALAAAFLNIDLFEEFAGGGFRAKLKKAVEEAYATIDNLKEIAKPLVITSMNSLTYKGRLWSRTTFEQDVDLYNILNKLVVSLKLDDPDLNRAIDDFHRLHTWDLYEIIISHLDNTNQNVAANELRKHVDSQTNDFVSENHIRQILQENKVPIDVSLDDLIKNYRFYVTNRKLRRSTKE